MQWKKQKRIFIEELPTFVETLEKLIKAGNSTLETLRFVYQLEDSNIIYCLTPFNFYDSLYNKPKIQLFYVYQVLEN